MKLGLAWHLCVFLIPTKVDVSPALFTVGFPEQVDCLSLMPLCVRQGQVLSSQVSLT